MMPPIDSNRDRNWCGRFITAIAFLASLQQISSAKLAAQEETDCFTVLEALKDSEASLNSCCWTGRYTILFENNVAPEDNYSKENDRYRVEFRVDKRNGRWWYDEIHSWVLDKFSREPFETRKIESFDGERRYRLLFTFSQEPTHAGFPPDRPYSLWIRRGRTNIEGFGPEMLVGLPFSQSRLGDRSLADLLATELATFEGMDRIAGALYPKLSVFLPSRSSRLDVWFDPAHGSLPIRREWRGMDEDGIPASSLKEVIETTKFAHFDLPSGDKVWFPVQGRKETTLGTLQTLELTELQFAESLPIESFRLNPDELPPGVFVRDLLAGKTYITGGEEGQRLYEDCQQLFDVVDEKLRRKLGEPAHAGLARHRLIQSEPQKSKDDESDRMLITIVVSLLAILLAFWNLARTYKRVKSG